jgi:hypothetical protein
VHVGIMASRPGTDWVIPWLQSPKRKVVPAGITMQTRGAPVSSLLGAFERAGFDIRDWGGSDLGRATGQLMDAVNGDKIAHRDQPILDIAAQSAVVKSLGDTYAIDRKNSRDDASPISAVAGAHWLLHNPTPEAPAPTIRFLGG